MHVLIAGGTGFLGRWLLRFLQHRHKDWTFTILSRGDKAPPGVEAEVITWNAYEAGEWVEQITQKQPVDVVVNLVGRSVDCRKTPATYDEILRSRVDATTILRKIFAEAEQRPQCWLQMSTAHIYGDPPTQVMTETSSHGYGMAPIVGKAWEAACSELPVHGCRDVIMRTGFVLGTEGGPLAILTRLARCGLGGSIAGGRQGMSWLHIADWCRLCENAILQPHIEGVYNYTAPHPVSQKQLMRLFRKAVGMPIGLPAPLLAVQVGSWLMNSDHEIICYGRYVKSRRFREDDFWFPTLQQALTDLRPGRIWGYNQQHKWFDYSSDTAKEKGIP